LVVVDEVWEVDYFLYENFEFKWFLFVWMIDFVGWLFMLDGGVVEVVFIVDYNVEMIE